MGAAASFAMEVLPGLDFADNGLPDFFLPGPVAAVIHHQERQGAQYSIRKDFSARRMVSY